MPVDEVVTLTLFHREDGQLARLMLDDAQKARLDRLWDELHFVSQDALTLVDAFAQLMEYATQDGDPKVFEPLRKPINDRAAAFRRRLVEAEPRQLDALLEFAGRAYRRPLTGPEAAPAPRPLRRAAGRGDPARRGVPADAGPGPGRAGVPLPGREAGPGGGARAGLGLGAGDPAELLPLVVAARRRAARARRVRPARRPRRRSRARPGGCSATTRPGGWRPNSPASGCTSPTSTSSTRRASGTSPRSLGLRGAMYEESVRFFTDLFQNDGSVLDILDADHTFLNEPLAEHYGIPLGPAGRARGLAAGRRDQAVRPGRDPRPGDDAGQAIGRLADQPDPPGQLDQRSPARRAPAPPAQGRPAAPRRRGGDRRPDRPPARREARQRRRSAPSATSGSTRSASRSKASTRSAAAARRTWATGRSTPGPRPWTGREFEGLDGPPDYLLTARREAFLRQFCRKLLGFALGRSTQLSDEPLLAEMQAALKANDYRVGPAIEVIVRSRQFREIRGRETAYTD